MSTGRQRHQHPRERLAIFAQLARITHGHAVARTALDGRGRLGGADRGGDDVIGVADREPVARERVALPVEVEEVAARRALGEHGARARHVAQNALDLQAYALQSFGIGPEDFESDGGANSRREHVDAVLDRHGERVRRAGDLDRTVHLVD